jgi:hypothetical protein
MPTTKRKMSNKKILSVAKRLFPLAFLSFTS